MTIREWLAGPAVRLAPGVDRAATVERLARRYAARTMDPNRRAERRARQSQIRWDLLAKDLERRFK